MAARVILITGGNAGLGYETLRSLLQSQHKYHIFLGGRSSSKAREAAEALRQEFPDTGSEVTSTQIDVTDDASIENCFKEVSSTHNHIDVLINNAGAQFDPDIRAGRMTSREGWNKTWDVNVTGAHILTSTFAPLLLKSSDPRLLFIASGTSTLAGTENLQNPLQAAPPAGLPRDFNGLFTSYRCAKTGMNMLMREWERFLRNDGVKVWAASPGYLATGLGAGRDFNKKMGAIDPTIGANFIRDVVEGKYDQSCGKVIQRNGIQPW